MLLEVIDLQQRDTHAAAAALARNGRRRCGEDPSLPTRRDLATEIVASGHRPAKAQPSMRCLRLGTWPGISANRRAEPVSEEPSLGTAPSRLAYRDDAAPEKLDHRRLLDFVAGIHDHDAFGNFSDHAEVMGDQNNRRPDAALESSINCRICAWIVTSSAVVGSSAIRSFGLQASEIAIITRWRMPPES